MITTWNLKFLDDTRITCYENYLEIKTFGKTDMVSLHISWNLLFNLKDPNDFLICAIDEALRQLKEKEETNERNNKEISAV